MVNVRNGWEDVDALRPGTTQQYQDAQFVLAFTSQSTLHLFPVLTEKAVLTCGVVKRTALVYWPDLGCGDQVQAA